MYYSCSQITGLAKKGTIDGETLMNLLEGPSNDVDGAYTLMCMEFLPTMVGVKNWKENVGKRSFDEFVTVSDEAFVMVVLENSWCHWLDVHEGKLSQDAWEKDNKERSSRKAKLLKENQIASDFKYTNGGTGCKGSQGWKANGISRFNHLYDMLENEREKCKFYKSLFEDIKTKNELKAKKRKPKQQEVSMPCSRGPCAKMMKTRDSMRGHPNAPAITNGVVPVQV
jgi:hypothetical protein